MVLDLLLLVAGNTANMLLVVGVDVNFKVVKTFVSRIKERAIGAEVSEALNPGQQIVKIVHEELVRILGEQSAPLDLGSASPAVIMLAGLQGSGKTTASGKLAKLLKKKGRSPLLVAAVAVAPACRDCPAWAAPAVALRHGWWRQADEQEGPQAQEEEEEEALTVHLRA